jgi:uracil phosphoribosyltransferase
MVFELVKETTIANHFLAELRDVNIQGDRLRFRKNLERIGQILAYEVSKKLEYETKVIETPLGKLETRMISGQPILIPILRAGIPFYNGVMSFFDQAGSGFIGAWRIEGQEELDVELNYMAAPSTEDRNVIIIDPMLATGKSLLLAVDRLLRHGKPRHVHILSVIAAQQGIDNIVENMPLDHSIWVGAIDEQLNSQSYIVPGLGDAGDLSFGPKL